MFEEKNVAWSLSAYDSYELVKEFVDNTDIADKENLVNTISAILWYYGCRPEDFAAAYAWTNFNDSIEAHSKWYDKMMANDKYEVVRQEALNKQLKLMEIRKSFAESHKFRSKKES